MPETPKATTGERDNMHKQLEKRNIQEEKGPSNPRSQMTPGLRQQAHHTWAITHTSDQNTNTTKPRVSTQEGPGGHGGPPRNWPLNINTQHGKGRGGQPADHANTGPL